MLGLLAGVSGKQVAGSPLDFPLLLQWFLFLAPATGWQVPWLSALIAGTIVLAALAAYCLAFVMISRRQHELLLLSLVPLSVVERVRRENPCLILKEDHDTLVNSGTPADRILDMMSQLLQGGTPSIQDVILVRTAMMKSFDLYAPIGVEQRIRDAVTDVSWCRSFVRLTHTHAWEGDRSTSHRYRSRKSSLSGTPSGSTCYMNAISK